MESENTMPGLNGGTLKRGNTVNVGRKRSEVREACIDGFNKALPKLIAMLDSGKLKPHEYAKLVDVLGKYGVGSVQHTEVTGEDGQALKVQYTFGPQKTAEASQNVVQSLIQPSETALNTLETQELPQESETASEEQT